MPTEAEIKAREKAFHDDRFGQDVDPRGKLDAVYSLTFASTQAYRSLLAMDFPVNGRFLEYGCGTGGDFNFYKSLRARLYGIDISEEAIQKARVRAQEQSIEAEFKVGDAENTGYDARFFDRIAGLGILHHLDLKKSLLELSRIAKKDGCCVFSEPLGHNPIINLFRYLTPKLRTSDEHPLKQHDLELMGRHFADVKVTYFYLLTFLALPLRRTTLFKPAYRLLTAADERLFKAFPWLGKYAWICVIELRSPKAA